MGFYEDMETSLLQAIAISKGDVDLKEKKNMPAPTFIAADKEKELIDQMIDIRKNLNISQKQLAIASGNKQQAISRIEKKENSPSVKTFVNLIHALGYDLQIVKSPMT